MDINTRNQQNYCGLIIGSGAKDYVLKTKLDSISKLKTRMDKLKNFDLELSKDGPAIVAKDTGAKFSGGFKLASDIPPQDNVLPITTFVTAKEIKGKVDLVLMYRNREEARRAYDSMAKKSNLGKAIDIIEKMDYDATKHKKEIQKLNK